MQSDNGVQLVRFTGANVSVMVLQGPKYSPQKSRPLESGHRRHGVCIAIECIASYKLDQKMNLNFCVNYAHFRKSGHIAIYIMNHGSGFIIVIARKNCENPNRTFTKIIF